MGLIIGVSGQARVGKDTFADYIVKHYRFVKVGLADPMKRFCAEVFRFSDEQLYGDKRDEPDKRYLQKKWIDGMGVENKKYLTPRYALQTLGTEWGRACYDDVWINYGIEVAHELFDGYATYSAQEGLDFTEKDPGLICGVVFSDIRFRNEFNAIKKAGGKVLRINRPGFEGKVGIAGHASESEQQGIRPEEFDLVVNNDSTLENYLGLIDSVMGKVLGVERRG